MFGDSTTVNPFGMSMPDYTGDRVFGHTPTNISGGALARGDVVMPCFNASTAAAHGFDPDLIWGTNGVFRAVIKPETLYDGTTGADLMAGPFAVVTQALGDSAADNAPVRVWDGGPNSSFMEVKVYHDWTTVLPAGELLFAVEGQTYLVTATLLNGIEATKSRAIGRTLARIPADAGGSTTALLKRIQFSGARGI